MRCHYEVLDVPRDSSIETIKLSYRSLCLKYHPDKNPNNIEEATLKFKEVQASWEILRNPQEKVWYDNHRDQVLRANNSNNQNDNNNKSDLDEINLYHYFNTSCYNGYEDGFGGFYQIYKELFIIIANLEQKIDEWDDNKDKDISIFEDAPGFGDSKTPLNSVKYFYSWWSNFVSIRSFAWHDKWNLLDAPSRAHRRAMEQENKKERQNARKEYIAEIRSLVEFIRRRDPRYKKFKDNIKAEEEKKQEEIVQKKKNEAEFKAMQYKIWMEEKLEEEKLMEKEQVSEQEIFEEDIQVFECFACNKIFKSEKQLNSHENSKKHKDALSKLKASLVEEEESVFNSNNSKNNYSKPNDLQTSSDNEDKLDKFITKKSKKSKKKKSKSKVSHFGIVSSESEHEAALVVDSEVESEEEKPLKKSKKKSKKLKSEEETSENEASNIKSKNSKKVVPDNEDLNDFSEEESLVKKSKKKKSKKDVGSDEEFEVTKSKKKNKLLIESDQDSAKGDVDVEIKSKKSKKKKVKAIKISDDENSDNFVIKKSPTIESDNVGNQTNFEDEMNNLNLDEDEVIIIDTKKFKKSKKDNLNQTKDEVKNEVKEELKCKGCKEIFTSKTKLFDHLKKYPKHAALKYA